MSDPRAELERLRKLKRLQELQARAGGSTADPAPVAESPAAPSESVADWKKQAREGNLIKQSDADDALAAVASAAPMRGAEKLASWLGKATGLSKVPDYLAQKAVGLKKYTAGVGDTLLDEGVWGTKRGMQKQVGKQIDSRGQQLNTGVEQLQKAGAEIDSMPIADRLDEMAGKFQTSSGDVPAAVAAEHKMLSDRAVDVGFRGKVAPQEALEYSRIAGSKGYNKSEPLERLSSKAAQTEQAGYSQALKDAYGETFPTDPNIVEEANSKLSALLRAKGSMDAKPSISQNMVRLLPDAAGAGIGYALGGHEGAAKGAALTHIARSPLAQSSLAKALSSGGKAISGATPLAARLAIAESLDNDAPKKDKKKK